jgi:Predicted transcriptional regulator
MKLIVSDICKLRGITLKQLAEILGISNVGLSQQINGNPTIETLDKIAKALNVEVWELFEHRNKTDLTALIDHQGHLYRANTIQELEFILSEIKKSEK